ncbi:hypothetical protein HNE_2278 [Hyphomonas neptunium ATCC 15444]|uniref:Uncharacterized protein n=1 Tax=Hyphomonas neptunium (strain ATCC 15444) TaxID=228405 RepID=Q0BZX0_HYPNA|nr:hypothetical protein HNE_2278 [Hyphomonas neptunium ATCC 15444]
MVVRRTSRAEMNTHWPGTTTVSIVSASSKSGSPERSTAFTAFPPPWHTCNTGVESTCAPSGKGWLTKTGTTSLPFAVTRMGGGTWAKAGAASAAASAIRKAFRIMMVLRSRDSVFQEVA